MAGPPPSDPVATSTAPSGGADSKPLNAADNKTTAALEEDDEFEDFPVEGRYRQLCYTTIFGLRLTLPDWPKEDEVSASAQGGANGTSHLWEESWDDDDTSDEFSVQLREELKKSGRK